MNNATIMRLMQGAFCLALAYVMMPGAGWGRLILASLLIGFVLSFQDEIQKQ